jgi:tetratricopeptide (TPR) repeat protein
MKKLQYQDFTPKTLWLIFRLDTQIADKSADVYMLMELPSGELLNSEVTLAEGLPSKQLKVFLQKAYEKKNYWPKNILVVKGDPIEKLIVKLTLPGSLQIEPCPASALENLIAPVKESFGEFCFSPSSLFYSHARDDVDTDEIESSRQSIPDAYSPCPCASGKKYKYCCKPIFREIMGAMAEAENGRKHEALKYIQEAKKRVGETAEVLCREAIVYSFFDKAEFDRLLNRCLEQFPNHPRANYIMGINLREQERFSDAIVYYKKAIESYPKTDRYHLNEAYNNIGSVYYDLKNYEEAKASWEQALFLLPSDRMVKQNLLQFIYMNPAVPEKLRIMGPMVAKFFEKRTS